ncbi:hypothetical protein AB1285_23215 [Microbacterium sp. NRRL B-14842]|uniref:hypothetical protein n=1 Tax=Microbacterium sp. NRRL B-14842 TaxID=3162881 RepID=UPI003D26E140
MTDIAVRLQEAMTIQTGTPSPSDGASASSRSTAPAATAAPSPNGCTGSSRRCSTVKRSAELTPGEDPTMGSRATLIEIIDDLAVSADHQGARAPRSPRSPQCRHVPPRRPAPPQSHALSELDADDETLEVIDEERTQIARTILLLDQADTAQAKERR